MKRHMNCPHCKASWALPRTEYGGYEREPLQLLMAEVAHHLRTEHGDEEHAIRMERYAVSPPPGEGGQPF